MSHARTEKKNCLIDSPKNIASVYGICVSQGKVITISGGVVKAEGRTKAIDGIVKNSIKGTGWTEAGNKVTIGETDESGQLLDYKKVQFPEEKPAPTPSPSVDAVQNVVDMINALPEPEKVTINDEAKINEARKAYDELTADQKSDPKLTDSIKKLTECESALKAAKKSADDQKAAANVSELINALPDNPAKATSKQVADAAAAYKALTDDQKSLITEAEKNKLVAAVKYPAKSRKAPMKSVKARKGRKATATWRKNSKVNGYQLVYSTSKKFTKKTTKKATAKSYKTVSKTVKNLKAGKRYFFKIRPYTNVENPVTDKTEKVYGKWSNVKKVKAKK